MATVTQDVREVALFAEREPRSVWVFSPTRETARLNDFVRVTPVSTAREVAQLNDIASGAIVPLVREIALLDDTPTPTIRGTRELREVAQLKSRALFGNRLTEDVREVAELNDAYLFDIALVLRDTAQLNDAVSLTRTIRVNLREVARLRGYSGAPTEMVVREVAELNDAPNVRVRTQGTLREVALLNDAQTVTVVQPSNLRDVALLNDKVVTVVRGGAPVLREVAYLADNAVAPAYGRAYTCSIVTWGMSTLSNFAFRTMAGKYAAGDNLWRLDGEDDNGTPIESYIKPGIVDMGDGHLKRVSAVYVAGSADGQLTVSVTGDVNGAKQTHDYTLEVRDQENYRNNRALVGKGFRSRFVQFKIGGTGIRYRLLAAEADVAATTRRL